MTRREGKGAVPAAVTAGAIAAAILVLGAVAWRLFPPPGGELVEQGRAVFWGRGRCAGCHPVGGAGGGVRGPDLGAAGGVTLAGRAASRRAGLDAPGYLVESLYRPDAYVVPGYPAGLMPPAGEPPVSLAPEDVAALVAYLLDDGAAGRAALEGARRLASGAGGAPGPGAGAEAGDAGAGHEVFVRMRCAACHVIEGVTPPGDADVSRRRGPDLTGIGAVQGRAYLETAVWEPDAVVVPGEGGRWLSDDGRTSRMPSYRETLTRDELRDLVAFLASLR